MAVQVAQLAVKVTADTSQATQALTGLLPMLSKTGPIALGAIAVGAGVAVIGAASLKMAGDFQAGLTTLVTGAGESGAAGVMRKIHDSILQMSVDTGESTKQLIAGLFMIESAGYHGQAGLDVLKAAAEGAKVGNADLGSVADATTTIMKDYAGSHITAAQAVNTLVAIVQNGKTHMEDLASSISTVLPAASKFGVSLTDVSAALATMTGAGVPAANATTYLRQLITSLAAPTSAGAKALASVGLTAQQVSDEMKKSLPDTLKMITDAIGKTFPKGSTEAATAFREIAGGSRQMQGMLDLTGTSLKTFNDNVKAVSDQVNKGGNQIIGWTMVQGTFNEQMSRAKAAVEVLMISLGEHLLPVATRLMSFLANNLIPTVQNFIKFITGTSQQAEVLRPILIAVAAIIGGVLVAAVAAYTVVAIGAAIATIAATWEVLAVGAAIGLLVGALIFAYTHWGWFRDAVNVAKNVLGDILGFIGAHVLPILGQLASFILNGVVSQFMFWVGAIKNVIGFFQALIGIIGQVIGKVQAVTGAIGGAVSAAGNIAGGVLSHLPHLAGGGIVTSPTVALVGESGPEAIVPLRGGSGSSAGGGTSGLPMTLIMQVDGYTLARVVTKYQPGVIRQATGTRAF